MLILTNVDVLELLETSTGKGKDGKTYYFISIGCKRTYQKFKFLVSDKVYHKATRIKQYSTIKCDFALSVTQGPDNKTQYKVYVNDIEEY